MVIRTALKQEGLAGKVDILPLGGLGPALTALAQARCRSGCKRPLSKIPDFSET